MPVAVEIAGRRRRSEVMLEEEESMRVQLVSKNRREGEAISSCRVHPRESQRLVWMELRTDGVSWPVVSTSERQMRQTVALA